MNAALTLFDKVKGRVPDQRAVAKNPDIAFRQPCLNVSANGNSFCLGLAFEQTEPFGFLNVRFDLAIQKALTRDLMSVAHSCTGLQ